MDPVLAVGAMTDTHVEVGRDPPPWWPGTKREATDDEPVAQLDGRCRCVRGEDPQDGDPMAGRRKGRGFAKDSAVAGDVVGHDHHDAHGVTGGWLAPRSRAGADGQYPASHVAHLTATVRARLLQGRQVASDTMVPTAVGWPGIQTRRQTPHRRQ